MTYDKNIHHRRSVRLSGFDYSSANFYFITICTHEKQCLFGHVHDGEVILNSVGRIIDNCWNDIPKRFPNVILHEYIIMPNHIHGVIEIMDNAVDSVADRVGAGFPVTHNGGAQICAPTSREPVGAHICALTKQPKFGEKISMLASIIRGFKAGSSKLAGRKLWQRNYYEHIIGDGEEYFGFRSYIMNNPQTWDADKLYQRQLDQFNGQFE